MNPRDRHQCDLRIGREDPEAFGRFYRENVGRIYVHLARRVLDTQVAMDLTAETFAQAYIARRRFRGTTDGQAVAWLYRIATRQVSRFVRSGAAERRALRRVGIEPPHLDDEEHGRLERLSATAELRGVVREELQRLSQSQRDALKLRVVDELSYADVASMLNITEAAARVRVMRGLHKLAEVLNNQHAVPEEERS